MLCALYAIARSSVCPSVTWVIHTKTVEDKIRKFSPYGSPIHLVSVWVSYYLEILMGPPPERGR